MKKWVTWIIVILMTAGIMAGIFRVFQLAEHSETSGSDQISTEITENQDSENSKPVYNTRQQVYANENPDLSETEVKRNVFLGLDRNDYENPETVKNPDDIEVFVSKHWSLPENYHPNDLTEVDGYQLRKEAADAWNALKNELAGQGIEISLEGGYISPEDTQNLYNEAINQYGSERTEAVLSRPLFFDSNTGLGLDFSLSGTDDLAGDSRYQTVIQKASEFGFIVRYTADNESLSEITAQPSHLRYVGTELAKFLYTENKSLESWFAGKSVA